MTKPRRIIISALGAGLLALMALPGAASANVIVQPSPVTFPEREVGSTSDPQTATVTIVCNSFNAMTVQCSSLDTFTRNPQFFGDNPGDFFFVEGGTCPPTLTLTNAPVVQCSILLRFKPTAAGDRQAVFLAGSSASGGPNPIVVQGSAIAKPVAPKKCKKGKKKKSKKCKKKKKK